MKSKILFFASLAELVGREEAEHEFPDGILVGEMLDRLEKAHPALAQYQRRFRVAVNQEFVELSSPLSQGGEIALIPPVSGGAPAHIRVAISEEPLDMGRAATEVTRLDCGAVVTFSGIVRAQTGEDTTDKLVYSAYREMAEKELLKICEQATQRWELGACVVEHRVGELHPGEPAVVVACSSAHRGAAFEAARFLIDTTKATVPLWKKEYSPDGVAWHEGDARTASSLPVTFSSSVNGG